MQSSAEGLFYVPCGTWHERRRIGWFFAAFAIAGVARALPVNPVVPAIAVGFLPVALGVAMLRTACSTATGC